MKDLHGKSILITGGGGIGVGGGVCTVLQGLGCQLIINEIDEDRAATARSKYPQAYVVQADVGNKEEVEQMWEKIIDGVGVPDGLVNNAGIGLTKRFWEASEEEYQRLHQVNVAGVWRMCKAYAQRLLDLGKTGSIVNISSIHAAATAPTYSIYSSAKSAVEALTKGMAVELGQHDIRVNAVAPGYVHAEQNFDLIRSWTPDPEKWVADHTQDHQVLRHLIHSEDCGNAVAFLLSTISKSTTGHILRVDNGMTLQLYNNQFMQNQ